jgi:hypothetical protein
MTLHAACARTARALAAHACGATPRRSHAQPQFLAPWDLGTLGLSRNLTHLVLQSCSVRSLAALAGCPKLKALKVGARACVCRPD